MTVGIVLGALFGAGALLVFMSTWIEDEAPRPARRSQRWKRVDDDLVRIGLPRLRAAHMVAVSVVAGLIAMILCIGLTGALVPAAAAGGFAAWAPWALLSLLAGRRRESLRAVWPDVIDHVNSAVRAGLSLPEALSQLAEHGPEPLRDVFAEFGKDYQTTGDFGHCLDRLKERVSDPVCDRIVEALRITRDVGGSDLGTLLRTLARFLRDDARVRSELEARQSWTVNGARLALIAPWAVLGMMVLRPEAAKAYDTPQGALLVGVGAIVSIVAYRAMIRIGRLPQDERVMA